MFSRNVLIRSDKITTGRTAHHDKYGWNNKLYAPMAEPTNTRGVIPTAESLKDCMLDYNLLYSAWTHGLSPELKDYVDAGHERHSVFSDPGFTNWVEGDFTPTPDSPIFQLGIKPLDTDTVGLLDNFPCRFWEKAQNYRHQIF